MRSVTLEMAQATLPDLLKQVEHGEEFIITQNGEPKGMLCAVPPRKNTQARAGSLAGQIWMAPDFDAPLADFKRYS
jgi:prevent-host-death family protein